MSICAFAVKQKDGTYLLRIDPTVTDPTVCPYVVGTGKETLLYSLADLSPENALQISLAVALLWAGAWGIRLIGKSFLTHYESSHHE